MDWDFVSAWLEVVGAFIAGGIVAVVIYKLILAACS